MTKKLLDYSLALCFWPLFNKLYYEIHFSPLIKYTQIKSWVFQKKGFQCQLKAISDVIQLVESKTNLSVIVTHLCQCSLVPKPPVRETEFLYKYS